MAIAGNQFDARETTRHEAAQERQSEGAVFTRSNIHSEHFALAVLVDADGDDYRHADHAMVVPHFEERRVQPAERVRAIQLAHNAETP